jgi:hypothetical protein
MPLVSVVIPSFNHGKFIAECIQSVLNQTFQDWELIITDDGSSDRSVEIIKSFRDPRIRSFFFPENRGVHVAMANCFEQARGNYLAVLNSDDSFFPRKLEVQLAVMRDNPSIPAVFTHVKRIDEEGRMLLEDRLKPNGFHQRNRTRWQWLRRFFDHGNCLCHPSILINRALYGDLGTTTLMFHQLPDFLMWIKLCQRSDFYVVQEPLLNFRVRSRKTNVSAGTIETSERIAFEFRHILTEYENPECLAHLTEIFPELERYGAQIQLGTAPFFLGKLAFESKHPAVQCYGIDLLFRFLKDHPHFTVMENGTPLLGRTYLYRISGQTRIFADRSLWGSLKRKLLH